MTTEQLEPYRRLLEQRLQVLLNATAAQVGALIDEREPAADSVDVAADESERDLSLRVHDRERMLVEQVRSALERMNRGEYGVCVACGDDIGERRLLARPTATHCIDCQTEVEVRAR